MDVNCDLWTFEGYEDIPQKSQENETPDSHSMEKEVAPEEEQGCTYQDPPPTWG